MYCLNTARGFSTQQEREGGEEKVEPSFSQFHTVTILFTPDGCSRAFYERGKFEGEKAESSGVLIQTRLVKMVRGKKNSNRNEKSLPRNGNKQKFSALFAGAQLNFPRWYHNYPGGFCRARVYRTGFGSE